jgi:hypothetical protein
MVALRFGCGADQVFANRASLLGRKPELGLGQVQGNGARM